MLQVADRYVPLAVRRRLHRLGKPLCPESSSGGATCLFLDICGFTPLAERLGQQEGGAERLALVLSTLFGALVEIVQQHGGDVVKFCGDALLCIFTHHKGQQPGSGEGGGWGSEEIVADFREQVRAAVAAAMAIQAHTFTDRALAEVRFKIGVGCGELLSFYVGGVQQRWEYIVAGNALGRACRAEAQAQPSQLVVGTKTLRRAQAPGYRTEQVIQQTESSKGDDGDWLIVTGGPKFIQRNPSRGAKGGSGGGGSGHQPRTSWMDLGSLEDFGMDLGLASTPAPTSYRYRYDSNSILVVRLVKRFGLLTFSY